VATEGGRWDNGVTDAAKLAAIANDSGLHLVMTGSSAVLHCGAGRAGCRQREIEAHIIKRSAD